MVELFQSLFPYRTPSIRDVLFNMFGAGAFLLMAYPFKTDPKKVRGYLIVGIATGFAIALLPLMTLIVTANIYQAIGTSLFVDCIIGLVAGIIFLWKGHVKLKPVLTLAISGIICAAFGSLFSTGAKESDLKFLIATVLILFGLVLIRGGVKRNVDYVHSKVNIAWLRNHKQISFLFFGSVIGFASGFTGMGSSGSMTILLIFVMGYDLHTSIGTSLLMMSFIGFSGAITHGIQGEIVLHSAFIAAGGAAIGAVLGSFFANKINEDLLGRVIGGIITILGTIVLIELLIT